MAYGQQQKQKTHTKPRLFSFPIGKVALVALVALVQEQLEFAPEKLKTVCCSTKFP